MKRSAPPRGVPRNCEHCGKMFAAVQEHRGYKRKFCTQKCAGAAARGEALESYPSREELALLYHAKKMSLREIGKQYGKTYTWAASAMKARRIPTRSSKRSDYARKHTWTRIAGWSIKNKGEEFCRNCGAMAMHLHHIVPRSKTSLGREDYTKNGMPLCFNCHRGWHDRRVTIFRNRLRPEELDFAIAHGGPVWVERNYPYTPDEEAQRHLAVRLGEDPDAGWKLKGGARTPEEAWVRTVEEANQIVAEELSDAARDRITTREGEGL